MILPSLSISHPSFTLIVSFLLGSCFMGDIILPHGGFRHLIVYKKSDIIFQGTVVFCRRFLPPHGDRTVDQMTQAARSCKQNIAEGSATSGISKETELKLTGVARATLDELLEDDLDYLKSHHCFEWTMNDPRKTTARQFAIQHAEWAEWITSFETNSAETLCNLMIILIQLTKYLLEKMLQRQETEFKQQGGIRERMYMARTNSRSAEWRQRCFDFLNQAANMDDLTAKANEITRAVQEGIWQIKQKRGW